MATLQEDIQQSAEWISRALTGSGYRANFAPDSLSEIDRFFDEQSANGVARPGGLLSIDLGSRIFAVGSYIGEVVRRHMGGEWNTDDNDPQGEIGIALKLPGGTICWPVQRAMKRLKNGQEDGIAAWGTAMGLHAATSTQIRRSLFKRLFG